MNIEKIKVTIQDGVEIKEYEGNLVSVLAFTDLRGAQMTCGETRGCTSTPQATVVGMMESVLDAVENMSPNVETKRKFLTMIGEKLIKKVEKLERQEETEERPLTTEDIDDFLNSIFED